MPYLIMIKNFMKNNFEEFFKNKIQKFRDDNFFDKLKKEYLNNSSNIILRKDSYVTSLLNGLFPFDTNEIKIEIVDGFPECIIDFGVRLINKKYLFNGKFLITKNKVEILKLDIYLDGERKDFDFLNEEEINNLLKSLKFMCTKNYDNYTPKN